MATFFRMNVRWVEIHPEVKEARRRLEKAYDKKGNDLRVLSANDSQHGIGSLHPDGKAFDIEDESYDRILTKKEILTILGGNDGYELGQKYFDVVEYDWGYHIEYDPK